MMQIYTSNYLNSVIQKLRPKVWKTRMKGGGGGGELKSVLSIPETSAPPLLHAQNNTIYLLKRSIGKTL